MVFTTCAFLSEGILSQASYSTFDAYTSALGKTMLPDLLITDGGKGQMSAVKEIIDELNLDIPIAGLAKDGKHRTSELLYGFPPQTIGLKQNSPLFRLLTQIQDEVHRFAITFHRDGGRTGIV